MRRKPSRRSLAALEAALVLPVVVLLTLALVEYGWLFLQSQHLAHAARHGARVGVTIDATNADVQNAVAATMERAGLGDSGYVVTITPENVASLEKGQALTVTVDVLYANVSLGMRVVPVPGHLRASVTMASEG